MNAADKAQHLLAANAANSPVEGGLFLSNALQQVKLDYTQDSLKRIDAFLDQVRDKLKPVEAGFLQDPQKENFALTLAFYLGEYLARAAGKKVEWLSYEEAVARLPAHQAPERSPIAHVLGYLPSAYLMPMIVLKERLFSASGSMTAQKYVGDTLDLIESQVATRGDEWRPEHLDLFLDGKKVPGGVAFVEVLNRVGFDFSMASLGQIDSFLDDMRAGLKPQYGEFISRLQNANLVWMLATYLGRTAAQLKNCSLMWIDFQTAASLSKALSKKFETTFNCLLGDYMSHPMMVINERLFGDPKRASCKQYAETILALDIPLLVSLRRGAVPPSPKNEGFLARLRPQQKMVWQLPIRQAGFLAAYGAFMCEGGLATPMTLLQPHAGGKHLMVDLSMYGNPAEAHQRGLDQLEGNPEKLPYQAFMYEGYANLPHARLDAIVVDLRCYTKPALALTVAVPFLPAGSNKGLKLYSPKLVYCSEALSLAPEIAIAFYEGVDSNKAFKWHSYLDESG